jgi:hypothetical protein
VAVVREVAVGVMLEIVSAWIPGDRVTRRPRRKPDRCMAG